MTAAADGERAGALLADDQQSIRSVVAENAGPDVPDASGAEMAADGDMAGGVECAAGLVDGADAAAADADVGVGVDGAAAEVVGAGGEAGVAAADDESAIEVAVGGQRAA